MFRRDSPVRGIPLSPKEKEEEEIMAPYLVIGALVAVVLIILWLRNRKRKSEEWKQPTFTRATAMLKGTPVTTPGGVQLFYEKGVPQDLDHAIIDRAYENVFKKLECNGYTPNRAQHRPKIVVLNSILSPESQTPSYKIFIRPGNFYYGGPYDMEAGKGEEVDHYVLAAGEMIAAGEPHGDVIAVPHPQGKNDFLENIVDFEFEHIAYAWYDGVKFEETKVHGGGLGHPIISPCVPTGEAFTYPTTATDVTCCPQV
jgi:hypothetical protein